MIVKDKSLQDFDAIYWMGKKNTVTADLSKGMSVIDSAGIVGSSAFTSFNLLPYVKKKRSMKMKW